MTKTPDDVKARVSSAYNHAADYYDHSANSFWDLFGRRTVERLELPQGSRVLDLCCGTGASALPAAEAVGARGRVVAIDLAADLVQLGRKKASRLGLQNIDFHVGDMLGLDVGEERFDYVVCVFGLFFIPDMAAALRQMWGALGATGLLAVTTWGSGLFEPVNSTFWEAVRQKRQELYRTFSPWDRLGDPGAVTQVFTEAGLPTPTIVEEAGTHPIRNEVDARALMMGTGYRGTLEQLSESERTLVQSEVIEQIRQHSVTSIRADVIYTTCKKL